MALDGWDLSKIFRLVYDSTQVATTLTNYSWPVKIGASVGVGGADLTAIFDVLNPSNVDDDFTGTNGDSPSDLLWELTNNSASGTGEIYNNKFRISIPDTANDESIQLNSKFSVSGDFDLQIDYTEISNDIPSSSISFPIQFTISGGGNYIQLGVAYSSSGYIRMFYAGTSDSYTTITTHYSSGKLRFTRTGSTIKGYYWTGTQWEWNGDTGGKTFTTSFSDDVVLIIKTIADYNSGATTDCDNFTVNSGTISWPVGTNCKKIAIEQGNTGNQCYIEVIEERWDPDNNSGLLWFKAPSITATADAEYHLYYDPDQPDNSTYVGVTGSSAGQNAQSANAVFVCHQEQDPSGTAPQMLDSTSYGADGTSYGTMTSGDLVDGLLGKGVDYDGSDDYTNHGYNAAHDITDTLSVLVVLRPSITLNSGLSNYVGIINRHGSLLNKDSYALLVNPDGELHLGTYGGNIQSTTNSWSSGTTYVVGGTYDYNGGSPIGDLFVDGVKETLSTDSYDSMAGDTTDLTIGYYNLTFPGVIDEVIILHEVAPDAWFTVMNSAMRDTLITFSAIDYSLTLDGGGFAFTGGDTGLVCSRLLSPAAGTFALTGGTSDRVRQMFASGGDFVFTGGDTGLFTTRKFAIGGGDFTLTGGDLDIIYRYLACNGGDFTLTGGATDLLCSRLLEMNGTLFAFWWGDTGLLYNRLFSLDAGEYTFTGGNTGLLCSRLVDAAAGSFVFTGGDTDLVCSRVLGASGGAFIFTGGDTGLLAGRLLSASGGSFTYAGGDTVLKISRLLDAGAGEFTLTGADLAPIVSRILGLSAGTFTFTGGDASFPWYLGCSPGEFTFTFGTMTIPFGDFSMTISETAPHIEADATAPGVNTAAAAPRVDTGATAPGCIFGYAAPKIIITGSE